MEHDYDPIERMLELGMSMSVANQMMQTMNNCMNQTQVPTVQNMMPSMPGKQTNQDHEFYIVVDNNVAGPFKSNELTVLVKSGRLNAETMVWTKGMSNWAPAQTIPEINKVLMLARL